MDTDPTSRSCVLAVRLHFSLIVSRALNRTANRAVRRNQGCMSAEHPDMLVPCSINGTHTSSGSRGGAKNSLTFAKTFSRSKAETIRLFWPRNNYLNFRVMYPHKRVTFARKRRHPGSVLVARSVALLSPLFRGPFESESELKNLTKRQPFTALTVVCVTYLILFVPHSQKPR